MPRTLLLADDSITIQKVVAITFAAEDFTVVSVDNGEDAYARARELHPAIVLADVSMPRRNGYELAHALKSDPQLRQIPVLLLAGTFEPLDPAKATASLADGHLAKPFDTQVLIDKVNELLGTAPAAQPAAAVPAPVPAAPVRPAAPPQAWPPAGAPRPPAPQGGVPQRPVPLTQQPAARPPTSPFGIPAAPQVPVQAPAQAAVSQPARPAAPSIPAVPAQAPRAPLPLTSPFPSAAPVRPPTAPVPLQTSPFAPPQAAPPSAPAPSPFASATAPRPAAPAPAVPNPFPRQAPSAPAAARPPSPLPPSAPAPMPVAPAPSPTTNLWGAPPAARPAAPVPAAPPAAAPRVPAPAAAAPVPQPPAAPRPPTPERRPGSLTPTWGEQQLGSVRADAFGSTPAPAPVPAAPPAPAAPAFAQEPSLEVSDMAEAAAAASVQPSSADLSLDVPMDEEPPELLPEIEGFELGGSQDLDVGMTGGSSAFVSGALSDFSQQGGTVASGGIDFDDTGASDQPIELASPHEFLGDQTQPDIFGSEPFSAPAAAAPAPAPTPPLFDSAPAPEVAAAPAADGEAALRLALSQASREVIERVVWEVVPQLAEIILREHIERMEQKRTPQ